MKSSTKFSAPKFFVLSICTFCSIFNLHASGKKEQPTYPIQVTESIEQEDIEDIIEYEPAYEPPEINGEPESFKEIWGYVLASRYTEFTSSLPITDVGLFAAEVDSYGDLVDIPSRSLIKNYSGRVHLVIVAQSRALTHFCLDPQYGVRQKLIQQIVAASKPFDGVQLDLEYIPTRDRDHYYTFIQDLRKALGDKRLTMCVAARTRLLSEDVFPYAKLSEVVDRIIVMAYDEHWANSTPGPIASYDWCSRIANYATQTIPAEKLVMGMPFYGRTWQSNNQAGAWYNSGINRIMRENEVDTIVRENTVPSFSYKTEITVRGYFEDAYSTIEKCRLYKEKGVINIGFWQVGQADPNFWQWIYSDDN